MVDDDLEETAMNRERAVQTAVKIDGWQDTDELGWLYDRAGELSRGASWVEVGCWKGRSFFATAMGLTPGCSIYGVDTWKGNADSVVHWEVDFPTNWVEKHFDLCANLINALRNNDGVMAIKIVSPSTEAPAHLMPAIQAVYLDADHTYEGVKADIQAWRENLAPGGLLCGHDFCEDEDLAGITRAVPELLPGFKRGPKTIWYWRKP
jgi:hypothetical protein